MLVGRRDCLKLGVIALDFAHAKSMPSFSTCGCLVAAAAAGFCGAPHLGATLIIAYFFV